MDTETSVNRLDSAAMDKNGVPQVQNISTIHDEGGCFENCPVEGIRRY